jgi:UDP-N-acetylmuramoyl-tripeptide--D-alanyl-D-alanine ligase
MITLTAEEAGRALGSPSFPAPVAGVSIDSRTVKPGDLFVALRGERFDGHDFVDAALAAGASAAVVERGTWDYGSTADASSRRAGAPLYPVADTLEALWGLAREARRKSGVTVFAVTGSAGKTSTKDILGAMVAKVRRVVVTSSNQNNEIGVALTLLAVEADSEAVVVEMGMRGRGQIAALARVAEPDIGVITNIHPVHLELLGSLESIAEAKAELLCGLRPGGTAVVPSDCGLLQPYADQAGCRTVRFGVEPGCGGADVSAGLYAAGAGAPAGLAVRWPEGEVRVETGSVPRHTLENVAAAAAACYAAGLPLAVCVPGFREAQMSRGRGQVLEVPGLRVVDDTYNANPAAVRAALDDLVRVAREVGGRAVAVLGDMLELGPEEQCYHEQVGEYAAAVGVQALWGVGPRSQWTVEGFERTAGGEAAGHVASAAEISPVTAALRPGDVVLMKASRSVGLEKMVQAIVEEAERGRWMRPTGRESTA